MCGVTPRIVRIAMASRFLWDLTKQQLCYNMHFSCAMYLAILPAWPKLQCNITQKKRISCVYSTFLLSYIAVISTVIIHITLHQLIVA